MVCRQIYFNQRSKNNTLENDFVKSYKRSSFTLVLPIFRRFSSYIFVETKKFCINGSFPKNNKKMAKILCSLEIKKKDIFSVLITDMSVFSWQFARFSQKILCEHYNSVHEM